ncbi:hypothetical protein BST81_15555 [Leptolyngbya sp. 'hensonii']|uniref:hypothetical protein n=1 Tax=Leptolyngbya sp. 'hensonii' TaxID=1922337 RepID=UPI00095004B7|nr:hypothetical protein [Leptolyngbya sp. 'hensonii']OLP17733.1 hypothetical protein BST81_15555 [Leptolyngbya sp. 'hensonii']
MSSRKQSSPILRRLRARARSLGRPEFLASMAGLVLMGLFVWQYLVPPDQKNLLEQIVDRTSNDSLDQEDRSIGADIDNLPTLLSEINSESPSLNPIELSDPKQRDKPATPETQNSVPRSGSGPSANPLPIPNNPFADSTLLGLPDYQVLNFNSAFNPNRVGSSNPAIGSNSLLRPGLSQSGRQSATPARVSALQAEINQYAASQVQPGSPSQTGQNNSLSGSNIQTGQFFPSSTNQTYFGPATSYFSPSGTDTQTIPSALGINYQSIPTTSPSTIPLTNSTGEVSTLRRPTQVPLPGITTLPTAPSAAPVTLPVDPINVNSLRQTTVPSAIGPSTDSLGTANFGNRPTQILQTAPAPFSVPRSIGNGQINTFSNP